MRTLAGVGGGIVLGASQASPNLNIDLTPIIVAFLAVVGAIAAAGLITTRRQKAVQEAQASETRANAKLAEGNTILTHAQYEGFISEAAERIQNMSEVAIARLETDLAKAQAKISELETELTKVKSERDVNLANAAIRAHDLQIEINTMRDKVADLERRLEAHGAPTRRTSDPVTPERKPPRRTPPRE